MRILCVHQGFELYGADRCFLDSVAAIRDLLPSATLHVLIPREGPLAELLRDVSDDVQVTPLWIARKRGFGRLIAMAAITFPRALARAVDHFQNHDLVYINTVTVIDFIVAAAFFRAKALLHVHEAPGGFIGAALGLLVRAVNVPTIYNSQATRRAYRPRDERTTGYVLYNGFRCDSPALKCDYDGHRPLRLLMLGRLSLAKGQDLLIEACGLLPAAVRENIEVRIVGDTFDAQTSIKLRLSGLVKTIGGENFIRMEPFAADPGPLYEWCDLSIVPSRIPEGFGRIPIEAMAHGRASIVAAQGGLTEIVLPDETGWHFTPNDAGSLAAAISFACEHPDLVRRYGEAGRRRFEDMFTAEKINSQLQDIVRERINFLKSQRMAYVL